MNDGADQLEPLTPADCDLRGMPYMPLDLVRLFDSDFYAISTGEEFKAGLTLWGRSFLQVPAGSLPDDDRILAHLSGAGRRWATVREVAMRGWVKCSDGRWYHAVVAQKAIEAWAKRSAFRERTRNATEARKQRREQRDVDKTVNVTSNVTTNVTSTKGEGEGTSKKERTPLPPKGGRESDSEFEAFWRAYPRREDKGHAEKAWRAARKFVEADAIMAGLVRFGFSDDPQYRPLPATWLNGKRWADEALPLAPKPTPTKFYDPRYFSPNRPENIIQLPRPPMGTPEDQAWFSAQNGFWTKPPDDYVARAA